MVACHGGSKEIPPAKRVAALSPAGRWLIKDYAVTVPAIDDAWLVSASKSFGLELGVGPRPSELFGDPPAKLEIHTNCEGLCRPAEYEQIVQTKLVDSVTKNLTDDAHGAVEWVQRPVKKGDRWWMHVRVTTGGNVVHELGIVTAQLPGVDGGWLECRAEVGQPELARFPALLAVCENLQVERADPARPFEPPYGHHYVLGEVTFDLAPPAGFHLERYERRGIRDELAFGGASYSDEINLATDCNGECDPKTLRANLDRAFGSAKPQEVAPNRWLERSPDRLTIRAMRPGAHYFLVCTARLDGDSLPRLDEMQKVCLDAMRPW